MPIPPQGSLPQRHVDTLRVSEHAIDRWIDRVDPDCSRTAARCHIEQHFLDAFDIPSPGRTDSETRVHPETGLFIPYGYAYNPTIEGYHATVITVYRHDGREDGRLQYDLLRYCTDCGKYLRSPTSKSCTCPHCDASRESTEPMFEHLPARSASGRNHFINSDRQVEWRVYSDPS